jgi:hypothetical protein
VYSSHCLAPFPIYPRPKDEATLTNLVVSNGHDMANYDEVSHEFFDFCANVITSEV